MPEMIANQPENPFGNDPGCGSDMTGTRSRLPCEYIWPNSLPRFSTPEADSRWYRRKDWSGSSYNLSLEVQRRRLRVADDCPSLHLTGHLRIELVPKRVPSAAGQGEE
jgi:hypothetical protein